MPGRLLNVLYSPKTKMVLFLFYAILFPASSLLANIGQPGMWKAGGGMSLFVEKDSTASKFIALHSERIDLFIYSGFAIVHGHYTFLNTSESGIDLTMGYPVNSIWNGESTSEPFGYSFILDSLASFEVYAGGLPVKTKFKSTFKSKNDLDQNAWYVWSTYFRGRDTLQFDVIYLTPTQHANITNMTGKKEAHGLMYIFESGSTWKESIGEVNLYVHFEDGLSSGEVLGIRPCNEVKLIQKDDILYFHKSGWNPQNGENYYMIYKSRMNKYYSYAEAVQDKKQLFFDAREYSKKEFDTSLISDFGCSDILTIKTQTPMAGIVTYMIGAGLIIAGTVMFFLITNLKNKRK